MPYLKIIRHPETYKKLGIGRTTYFNMINEKSPRFDRSFPKRVHISCRCIGFYEHEVDAWILSRRDLEV